MVSGPESWGIWGGGGSLSEARGVTNMGFLLHVHCYLLTERERHTHLHTHTPDRWDAVQVQCWVSAGLPEQRAECGEGPLEFQGPCLSWFSARVKLEWKVMCPSARRFHPGPSLFALDATCRRASCVGLPPPRPALATSQQLDTHMHMALWHIQDNEPATELQLRPVQEG